MRVIIVGGVAGGATAAARIRRLNEQAEVTVYEKTGFISYANCGLPYYIGDVISDAKELTLQTPASFRQRFCVDMKVHHEVLRIHPENKTVEVKNLETGEVFEDHYDKLLLSPGARPVKPPLPGVDSCRIYTLRTVEDTLHLKEEIQVRNAQSAVIAGGGFIGVELAENLKEAGLDVTIVEMLPQLMSPFDSDMASFLHAEVRKHGVNLRLGTKIGGFQETEGGIDVLLEGQETLHADLAVLAVGVAPDTAMAAEAGLKLGVRGSIVVNEKMETSVPDIYAVGDAVQIRHLVSGQDALVPLAGPANKQARIAADNICGYDSRYQGAQGSSVLKIFQMSAASTGLNERMAKQAGLQTDKVILSPMSHAGYYPGGKVMTIKVVFEKETFRILGAQIAGYEGVDKRIDVIAAAMQAGLKAWELKDLELSYAPPYSSAKDPVNMAGFMIDNVANGILKQWFVEDEPLLPRDGSVTLLDVRTAGEYGRGHMEGFANIPVDELREHLDEIPRGKPVYVNCQSGIRSYIACRILEGNGYEAYNFAGGYRFYDAVMHDKALIQAATECGMDR